jgi:hypothetical protein
VGRIAEVAAGRDIPSLRVIFPFAFQLESPAASASPQRRLLAFGRLRALPTLDLLPVLADAGVDVAFLDPSHLSPRGHAVAAAAIVERILAARWLGTSRAAR